MIYLPGWPVLPTTLQITQRDAQGGSTHTIDLDALRRDAARYRWLRANPIMAETVFSRVVVKPGADILMQVDELVDAVSYADTTEATDGQPTRRD